MRRQSHGVRIIRRRPENLSPDISRESRPEPIIDAIMHVDQTFVRAKEAKNSLKTFFRVLLEANPASVGGKMPDEDFYGE